MNGIGPVIATSTSSGAMRGRVVVVDTAQRLLDTRADGGSRLGPEATVRIPLPDGVPADATALAVNLTVAQTRSSGFDRYTKAGAHVIVDMTGWFTHSREVASDKGASIPGNRTYAPPNARIRYHASANQDVVAMEWSRVARQVPFWLYSDGIHLDKYGGHDLADFMSRAVAHVTGQPCPMPQARGGSTAGRCPDPGLIPAVDVASLDGV